MKKRIFSLFLALALCLTLLPAAAWAEGEVTYIDANGEEQTQTGCKEITSATTELTDAGWYAVKEDVTIDGNLTVNADNEVHLILCDGATLTVMGSVILGNGWSLNIYGQSGHTGTLRIGSDTLDASAIMASASGSSGGTVNFYGGTVIMQANAEHETVASRVGANPEAEMKVVWTNKPNTSCNLRNTTGTSVTITKCKNHVLKYNNYGESGHKARCTLCNKMDPTDDSVTPHTLSYVTTNTTHKQKCSVCGYETAEAAHSFDETTGKCSQCGLTCEHKNVDEDHNCTFCQQQMVARADGKYYTTLTDAIAGAGGAEITLIAAVDEAVTVTSKTTAVINLGGRKYWTATGGNPALTIKGGSVTLRNGALAQSGDGGETPDAIFVSNGELIVENTVTEIAGAVFAIYANGGTLTLRGDTLLTGGLAVTNSATVKSGQNGDVTGLTSGVFTQSGALSPSIQRTGDSTTTLFVLLAEGYAFAKYENGKPGDFLTAENLFTSNPTGILYNVTVVKCTHKNGNTSLLEISGGTSKCKACGFTCSEHEFDNGVCTLCGYVCPHEHVSETRHTSAVCDVCNTQMAVKVTSGDTTTYYAQRFENGSGEVTDRTLKDLLNNDGITPSGCTVTLLMDDLNAWAHVTGGRTITLDMNGKNLIETGNGICAYSDNQNNKLIVTGTGSSENTKSYDCSRAFAVYGGTLEFDGNFCVKDGGKLNGVYVGSGTLTSKVDFKDYLKIGTLEIDSSDAQISFKQGTFDKITIGEAATGVSVMLGDLLGIWEDAEGNAVRSGNAFQNEGGTFLRYNTVITKNNPIKNVKLAVCHHDSVTNRTCDYCRTEHIVALVIDGGGSVGTYAAKSDREDDMKTAMDYALNGWNDEHGNGKELKLFVDFVIDTDVILNAVKSGSQTQRTIDLNGHSITGGTLTASDLVTLTITDSSDSSESKGSISTPVTVNGGATLTVEGVSVGKITAADKTAKITLKEGTTFTGYKLSEGMCLAQWIESRCRVTNASGAAVSLTNSETEEQLGSFTVTKAPATITAGSKTGEISYGGNVPETLLPTITPTSDAPDHYEILWFRRTDTEAKHISSGKLKDGVFEYGSNYPDFKGVTAGDMLDVFCVIKACDASYNYLWQTVVTGYTLTVTKGQAAVTKAPTANTLTYTGSAQNLVAAGSATGGTMQYSLEQNGPYSTAIPTGEKAGEYTVWYKVVGDDNHNDSAEQSITVTIAQKAVTSPTIKIATGSTYDGTAQNPTVTVKDGGNTIDPEEYTVTYSNNINAGENTATVTITDKEGGNYTVSGSAKFSIHKAAAPTNKQSGIITVYNNREADYHFDVSELLPTLDGPEKYGDVTYALSWNLQNSAYTVSGQTIENSGLLILHVAAQNVDTENGVGSFKITVTSTNYEDFDLTVNVVAANRLTLTGAPTLSKTELTYGDELGKIALSGTMTGENGETVTGTFQWKDGTVTPGAGNYDAEWKFTPDNTIYAEATGTTQIKVNKATPVVTAPKAIEGLIYNGEAQELFTAGTTTGGTMMYRVQESVWGDGVIERSNAGTYIIYYRVDGGNNYVDVAEQSITVTIEPKEVTVTVTATDREYNGGLGVALVPGEVVGRVGSDDDVTVDLRSAAGTMADANVGENKPVTVTGAALGGTDAGNYKLKEQPSGVTVSISRTAPTCTAPTTKALTYNGEAQDLITAGETADGEIQYKLGADGTYSAALPQADQAGDYVVYYRVAGDDNHTTMELGSISVTIAPATVEITVLDKAAYVGGTVPELTDPKADVDYRVEGLFGDDTLLTGPTLTYAETPDMTKEGETAIIASGANAGSNYAINYVPGALRVTVYVAPTYPVAVAETEHGSVSAAPARARSGQTVTLTVTPDEGYTLETLTVTDRSGSAIELTDLGGGQYSFKMPTGQVNVSAAFMDDNTMLNFFVDVTAEDYFYDAVLWAVHNGITNGTDELHFSPNDGCTRAQIVTFLWRAAGEPVVDYLLPFADVAPDAYYAEAVRWAASEGIVAGTSATTFSPDAVCTRAQIAAMLWRSAGEPVVNYAMDFSDVEEGAYYAEAVRWAASTRITSGTGDATFTPDAACTRAQVVTFLYRSVLNK